MNSLLKTKTVVAFIDILGFKNLIKNNKKEANDLIIEQLKDALEQAHTKAIFFIKKVIEGFDEYEFNGKIKHRQFSDNIFISFDYDEKIDLEDAVYFISYMAAYYQRLMLTKGFFVRGGIAMGESYFNEHMIFSDALMSAYEIESHISKYPRIVIDNNILKKLNKKDNIFKAVLPKLIVKRLVRCCISQSI